MFRRRTATSADAPALHQLRALKTHYGALVCQLANIVLMKVEARLSRKLSDEGIISPTRSHASAREML